jgi:DNA end-binding protein Ku
MARSIWSGAISFGLVNVPVKLYTAVRDHSIHFHMLGPDGKCRLRRKLVCPETGAEVDWKDTKRGYEVAPDQYIIMDDEELNALRPRATRTIEIKDFVDLKDIDPVYYNTPYYLLPDERAAKPYRLLHEAMNRAKKVGIATFVMRQKQYLAALRPVEKVLVLETMNYADEIADPSELPEAGLDAKVDKRELDMAQRLIDALSGKFDPRKYRDEYRQEVLKLIEKKAEGEEVHIAPAPEEPQRVHDLVKALEASLAEARGRHAEGPGRSKQPRSSAGARPRARARAGEAGRSAAHRKKAP